MRWGRQGLLPSFIAAIGNRCCFRSHACADLRAPSMPNTKTAKTPNKSDFIRAQPASLSVAEVIAKGKAEGIEIGSSLVYMVRGRSPGKAKTGTAKVTTSTATAVNGTAASVTLPAASSSAEDLLRAIAAELGLARAVEILAGERARVRAIIGG